VIGGVERMRRREISGQKLVYLVETRYLSPPRSPQPTTSALITESSKSKATVLPATQTALKIQGPGKIGLQTSCPLPSVREDEVLVRVICVAVNPEDWKSADMSPAVGATSGCDFAGVIVKVGQKVRKALFSIDDRVCGFVFGNNPDARDNGSFAEYAVAAADLIWKIPPETSFEAASTLGIGVGTVGMALYNTLQLPLPMWPARTPPTGESEAEAPEYVLVYGGGTATGGLAIQMIRM
jgi:aspyridone synthetase trans-acting enoyl reductase